VDALDSSLFQSLLLIAVFWVTIVSVSKHLHLEKHGLETHTLYIIYKSQRVNNLLLRLASWNPLFWRIIGDIGVATAFGQMVFLGWLLVGNLLNFFVNLPSASPMIPLIPGITVKPQSLPYFFVSASLSVLIHEIAHGVLCVIEQVKVKNSALLLAVVFFGGAIQPDEEEMEKKEGIGRMRIYAVGSLTNLIVGFIALFLGTLLEQSLPEPFVTTLQWINFLSINLAVINMLPVYPFDGDGVLNTLFERLKQRGTILRTLTGGGFLALVGLNMAMSFIKFGVISF